MKQISSFLLEKEEIVDLVSSEYFARGQFSFLGVVDHPKIGIIEDILKRLVEMMLRTDAEAPFKIKWIYKPELKAAYFIKAPLDPDWETECEGREALSKKSSD